LLHIGADIGLGEMKGYIWFVDQLKQVLAQPARGRTATADQAELPEPV
jgi:hypothetical protein